MSGHIARIEIVEERQNVHPLHVSVNPDKVSKLSIKGHDTMNFVAALSCVDFTHDIFVYVRVENMPSNHTTDKSEKNSRFILSCTRKFLKHYGMTAFLDDKENAIDSDEAPVIFIRKVDAPELSQILVATKNKKAFERVTEMSRQTPFAISWSQGPVLARVNDALLAPYPILSGDLNISRNLYFDIIMLQCSPYKQGLITANTDIIVTIGDSHLFKNYASDRTSTAGDLVSSFEDSDIVRDIETAADNANTVMESNVKFEVIIRASSWAHILDKPDLMADQTTLLYTAGFPNSLMIRHNLRDGDILKMSFSRNFSSSCDLNQTSPNVYNNLHTKRCNWLLAQCKRLNQDFDNHTNILIDPLMKFDLTGVIPDHQNQIFFQHYSNKDRFSTSYTVKELVLPYAYEVQVSVINSPEYNSKASFNKLLKAYFNKTRIISKGQVIALHSYDDSELYQDLSEDKRQHWPVIYFRVIHIEPNDGENIMFFVDQLHSTLIQVGSVQGYAPTGIDSYLSHIDVPTYFEQNELHGLQNYVDRLKELIEPYLHLSPERLQGQGLLPTVLVCGPSGCGKTSVILFVCRSLYMHVYQVNCQRFCCDTQSATEAKLNNVFATAKDYAPCILLLENIHLVGKGRIGQEEDARVAKSFTTYVRQLSLMQYRYPVVVVATTSSVELVSQDILDYFLLSIDIKAPNEDERRELLSELISDMSVTSDVDINYLSLRTAGFVLGDMFALISQVQKQALKRICKSLSTSSVKLQKEKDIVSAGILFQQNDFTEALDALQAAHSHRLGAPQIPNVKWQDIGGLIEAKTDILDTIQLPLRYPKLSAAGLKRSGVLLYGPPGTGKTLLAKAVATECSLNFLSVKGPELINQFVGQSEENVREVFERAREASPCVIFFDELDSLAPNRGRSGDSGGVMDRIVSQLLVEIDGLHKLQDVFIIGATNRPDLIDPALLRPGRFDKLVYLGVCDDHSSQHKILKALTRKFHLNDDVNLEEICRMCPLNLTGADLYSLCSDAMMNAIRRKIHKCSLNKTVVGDSTIIVSMADFQNALSNIHPSVTDEELVRHQKLFKTMSQISSTSDL